MKANKTQTVFTTDPTVFLLKDLTVRPLKDEDYSRAGELLEQEHYLGDCPEGRQLLQVVEYNGYWVALLDWGPACWKLADRETYIGWTAQQRAERLGLIVQNRRFLALGKERMPNLASRALGLALKALPEHWQERHGYRPLMAETFTDIEQFEGTCYKASNWEPIGLTKGFQRHRADYFQKHGRPKKLWIYPFEPLEANLPGARSLTVIYRTRTTDPEEERPVAFFISSMAPEEGCAQTFANLARGHWGGCEIRNHWVRDHCMREDKTQSKNYNLNCALSALRVCLIAIKSLLYPTQSWPEIQECCQRDPSIALKAISKMRAK